ncbi:MAG: hypothetical protein AABP62_13715 [Planctomycetota bacterium]
MLEPQAGKTQPNEMPQNRTRKWLLFAIGFLVVFIGMAVLTNMTTMVMRPSGPGLMQCRLWQYYMIEFRQASLFESLGPASGRYGAAMMTALEHLLCSVIGGGVFMVVWRLIHKTRP